MAYKVQIADANLRGSIVAPENVTVSTDVEGALVTSVAQVEIAGTCTLATGDVAATTAIKQYKGSAASGDVLIELSHNANVPKVQLYDVANNQLDLHMGIDSGGGIIVVGSNIDDETDNADFVDGVLKGEGGSFTGNDFHVSGAYQCANVALSHVNVRVAGTTSTTTGVASLKDDIIALGSGSAAVAGDMDIAGILLGKDNTGVSTDGGAGILYRTSGTKFQVTNLRDGAGSNLYSLKAHKFFGSGAGLTGFSFSGFDPTIIEPASAATTTLANSDIGKIFVASFNGTQTVTLPTLGGGGPASGDFFVFKNGRGANSKIILKTSSNQTIDGINCDSGNITIENADAAFRIFTDGSNYFME